MPQSTHTNSATIKTRTPFQNEQATSQKRRRTIQKSGGAGSNVVDPV